MEISSETRPLSKRVRTDTFWKCSEKDNSEYFGKILDGEHDIYYVDQEADVNLDYRQTKRHCWQLRNKATGNYVPGIRSTETYRLSLLWSLSAGFWQRESKKTEGRYCDSNASNEAGEAFPTSVSKFLVL